MRSESSSSSRPSVLSPVWVGTVGVALVFLLAAAVWPAGAGDEPAEAAFAPTTTTWPPSTRVPQPTAASVVPSSAGATPALAGAGPSEITGTVEAADPAVDQPVTTAVAEPRNAIEGRTVLIIGDSLTKAALDDIGEALYGAGASIVRVGAQNGAHIRWMARQLPWQAYHDIVIIAGGTNDAHRAWSDRLEAEVDAALSAVGTSSCRIWVLPTAWRHPRFAGHRESYLDPEAASFVSHLRSYVGRAGWWVAGWDAVAAFQPAIHTDDGVHHTDEGERVYARFMASSIEQGCRDAF